MRQREGFTLIELLVVVAIISLLVSILLPSLKKAKDLAKSLLCETNLKALGTGFQFYINDWDGKLPPVNAVISYNANSIYQKAYGMVNCLGRYFDHPEWEDCWYNFGAIKAEFRKTPFICPLKENAVAWRSGFGESFYLQTPGGRGGPNPRAWSVSRPVDGISNPGASIHVADSRNDWNLGNWNEVDTSPYIFELRRHLDGVNILFADSHVDHYGAQAVIENINEDFELP